jgi:hypothetical protein
MLEFQHSIPRFKIKLPYFENLPHSKRGGIMGVKRGPKDRVKKPVFGGYHNFMILVGSGFHYFPLSL